jgi:uncharacterized protein (UPF0335 family)
MNFKINIFLDVELNRMIKKVQTLEVDKKVLNDIIKEMVFEQVIISVIFYKIMNEGFY